MAFLFFTHFLIFAMRTQPTPLHPLDVPLPIVTFGRWIHCGTLLAAFVLQQPVITTALLIILLAGLLGGNAWNAIGLVGKRLFATQLRGAEREDYRMMRFNTLIAITLLSGAQIAFVLGAPVVAWVLVWAVIAASAVALAGFCLGCFLYYQFKLNTRKILGER
jgi:hypothetical protein